MAEFYTVITTAGREAVARATQAGVKVDITHMAIGDGGGVPVTPNENQTQLVNECWRGLVATYSQQGSKLIIDTYIPPDEASFIAREMGLFTADGVLFAVCNTPEMRKVLPSEGAVGNFVLGMELDITNIDMAYIEIHTNPMLDFIPNSEKGQPNGVAELDENGKIPNEQLPDNIPILDEDGKIPSEQLPSMDFYTKEETLTAETMKIFGLDIKSVPNDVFQKIWLSVGSDVYGYYVTLKTPLGNPVVGQTVNISNRISTNGITNITDSEGKVLLISRDSEPTISFTPIFKDIKSYSKKHISNSPITEIEIISERIDDEYITFTSSSSGIKFSPDITLLDLSCVGGGADSGYAWRGNGYTEYYVSYAGAGGEIENAFDVPYDGYSLQLTIGSNGISGGNTVIKNTTDNVELLTAKGAATTFEYGSKAGTSPVSKSKNGGNGAETSVYNNQTTDVHNGANGSNRTAYPLNDESILCSGGGGSGSVKGGTPGTGGESGGGNGGSSASQNVVKGTDGRYPGSGGGSPGGNSAQYWTGTVPAEYKGLGQKGAVYIRPRYV